jgi:hypothetical protein
MLTTIYAIFPFAVATINPGDVPAITPIPGQQSSVCMAHRLKLHLVMGMGWMKIQIRIQTQSSQ